MPAAEAPCGDGTREEDDDDAGELKGHVRPVRQPSSVQCPALDEDHARCVAALARLAERRDLASLRAVHEEYAAHFAHEEAMLDEHLYVDVASGTGDDRGFNVDASTRTSHWKDHARMLRELQQLATSVAVSNGILGAGQVDAVLRDFETHADRYDGNYAERLGAKLGAIDTPHSMA
mmetsp:Transcript_7020/g.25877  ORF Transcript_7020/g.25877 Transcript_7020/m.25877 type:complete len:177 (-) Transcript_7020:257-787(-)